MNFETSIAVFRRLDTVTPPEGREAKHTAQVVCRRDPDRSPLSPCERTSGPHTLAQHPDPTPYAQSTYIATYKYVPTWSRPSHDHHIICGGVVLSLDRWKLSEVRQPGMRTPAPAAFAAMSEIILVGSCKHYRALPILVYNSITVSFCLHPFFLTLGYLAGRWMR